MARKNFKAHRLQILYQLAEMLTTNQTLKELNIAHVELFYEEISIIAKALHSNSTLQKLDMSMGEEILEPESISELLKQNGALKELNIRGLTSKSASSEGACMTLCENNTLEKLHIGCNNIGVHGAKVFASMLETNTTLRKMQIAIFVYS